MERAQVGLRHGVEAAEDADLVRARLRVGARGRGRGRIRIRVWVEAAEDADVRVDETEG